MPEGPELYKNSQMVNEVCKGRIFSGKIVKSAVSTKNPDVIFPARTYAIHAESRGKEMALILTSLDPDCSTKAFRQEKECKPRRLRILFRFGMSGKFSFGSVKDIHKHAHLNFYTKEKPLMVLSFVDVRRFGRWELSDDWSKDRGPDPMFEYDEFRSNVLENLDDRIFDKPLCEVMHNQKYFNGIGNYLRAEVTFRAGIPPFTCARAVFEKLKEKQVLNGKKIKLEECPDILELCHLVPREVINLPGKGYDPSGQHSDYSAFNEWLQCYYNPEMRNVVDHDGRTMWFKGEAGPMVPKDAKSRGMKKSRKRKAQKEKQEIDDVKVKKEVKLSPPKKRKTVARPVKTSKKGTKSGGAQNTRKRPSKSETPEISDVKAKKEKETEPTPPKKTKRIARAEKAVKKENSKKKVGQKKRKTEASLPKKMPVRRSIRAKKVTDKN